MNDPRAFLDCLSAGYQDSMILLSANHLGVFGALADGPRTTVDLAGDLDCDPRALELLLLALVQGLTEFLPVSSSGSRIMKPPSPHRHTTGRKGSASFAASAAGRQNPMVARPFDIRKSLGA